MSTEMNTDFFIAQNERGVYFCGMHPIKKLVYKIHSSFMICVIEFVYYMNTDSSLMHFLPMVLADPFAMQVEPVIFFEISPL
jgi:hypothetical protein